MRAILVQQALTGKPRGAAYSDGRAGTARSKAAFMATAPVPSSPEAARAPRRRRRGGFPAPVTVRRPAPGMLVIAEARARALVRLAIWLAVVGGFAAALLGAAQPGADVDAGARWLALLVPLVLLPYLVDGVRVLCRPREVVLDGARGELRARGRAPVTFAAIRGIEVQAVNATCEEADARVRLADGAAIALATGYRFEPVMALAREAAGIAGVPVHAVGAGGARPDDLGGDGELRR